MTCGLLSFWSNSLSQFTKSRAFQILFESVFLWSHISHWYGGVGNIKIKDEQFDDDNFGVTMHGHQSLLIDLVDQ